MSRTNLKAAAGFTFLELMAGIFLLIVGIVGITNLVVKFFAYSRFLCAKMTATYLSQEAIEIVRSIRDTNWIEEETWDNNIFCCRPAPYDCDISDPMVDSCSCDCRIVYGANGVELDEQNPGSLSPLWFSPDTIPYFSYVQVGAPTDFERIIHIEETEDDWLEVCATTQWKHKQQALEITVCDQLYNWYDPWEI